MTGEVLVMTARLHDGVRPVSQPVELELGPIELRVGAKTFARAELGVSPRTGQADRFLSLPDGTELQLPDANWLDSLPGVEPGAPSVAWLEQRWWVALTSLGGIMALGAWFWFFGLSLVALHAARHVPFELERRLGERSLKQLETEEWFVATELADETVDEISQRFSRLVMALPKDGYRYRLELRHAGVGPNAFALPGGIVVLTDDLVGLCTLDEVTAVLAHELGHAHGRHVMQGILGDAGLAAALGAVLRDVSSSGLDVVKVPALLLELGYSRELEQSADDASFGLLRKLELQPALLGDALERMERYDRIGWEAAHDAPSEAEAAEDEGAAGAAGAAGATNQADAEGELEALVPSDPVRSVAKNWVEMPPSGLAPEASAGSGWIDEGEDDPPVRHLPGFDDEPEPELDAEEETWSFLSSHPITAERIARARAAR